MKLLSTWEDRVANRQETENSIPISFGLKKSARYYGGNNNFVETSEQAQAMLEFAMQRPLSHIGFDTEFRYSRPGVQINKNNIAHDPTSIDPLLISLAMAEPGKDGAGGQLYSFVIDLRNPELLPALRELFRLPVTCCAHFAKVELFCLWKLGLSVQLMLWDTFIFEKLLSLGKYHHKYVTNKKSDDWEQSQIKEQVQEQKTFGLSLVATCQRYGVRHQMVNEKERLQQSFLNHPEGASFSDEQIGYAAEDAIAAAMLYPLQVQKSVEHGLIHHCETVEMDWVVTNARIEWEGVRIDIGKRDDAINRIGKFSTVLRGYILNEYGIENPQSHKQLAEFFKDQRLLDQFRKQGKISFNKEVLKENQSLHPVIPLLRAIRRSNDLLSDKLLSPEFVSPDGRIRAEHRQLGADTGRQAARWPNLLGLDRVLRSLVVPADGYGIGEVDWSQVEVGVAAAVYGDDALVRMFNSGDVYSAMAQHFFQNDLPAEDCTLPSEEFKVKHKALRNQMKTCTLGIIYGITPPGLARDLGYSVSEAAALQQGFMRMFPRLEEALRQASQYGALRGYANTISGLKRYRGRKGEANHWEKNWLTNHPVQGSAAVVFKAAGNRLRRLYQRYQTRIVIPVHDAFIFEAPLENLEEVAELTAQVMCRTLQEYFPDLRPSVDVNISRPDCWNKDGNGDELEHWIIRLQEVMERQHNHNMEV